MTELPCEDVKFLYNCLVKQWSILAPFVQIDSIKRSFDKFDLDGSGQIDRNELGSSDNSRPSIRFLQRTNAFFLILGGAPWCSIMLICFIVLRGPSLNFEVRKTKPHNSSPRFRDVVCNLMKVKTVS